MLLNEYEIPSQVILDLSSIERIAEFFAALGYNPNPEGFPQSTDALKNNLHPSDEELRNKIRWMRQIGFRSDVSFSKFYVYVYVLPSLTQTLIKRIFRDLSKHEGDYLVVVCDEKIEEIDIVYIDRTLGTNTHFVTQPSLPGIQPVFQNPVSTRMRLLSIKRSNPSHVVRRVLNRFRWPTNRSVATQCEILSSAYDVAEWSEEYFNNRALFSDHYLTTNVPAQDEWLDSRNNMREANHLTAAYQGLRRRYDDAADTFFEQPSGAMRKQLIEPALRILGFAIETSSQPYTLDDEHRRLPDYTLYVPDDMGQPTSKVAICLAYKWGRNLDGYEEVDDVLGVTSLDPTDRENPGAVVVSLLDQEKVDWAFLTNGRTWRLYSAKTHSRATNYYEIDLDETLAMPRDHADAKEAFRYFWFFFRANAFLPKKHDGYEEDLSFLDWLLRECERYALALGDSLKKNIFEEVFTYFAGGLVHDAQRQGALPENMGILTFEERDSLLKPFFNATLTLLYRLLFLLYAESRYLLPLHERRGFYPYSLTNLKAEIARLAESNEVQVRAKLQQHYSDKTYDLYTRLQALFEAIDRGREDWNVPVYNGGLFATQSAITCQPVTPASWKELIDSSTPEEVVTYILATFRVPDLSLSLGLDKLTRGVDLARHELVSIDYKSLGVRQLGSIYEGLLEFKLRIALEEMVVIKEKYLPLSEAVRGGSYVAGRTTVIQANELYIENDRQERKVTGSYYTPDYIVEYIIEQTVGPALDMKEAQLLPKFRSFEQQILQRQRESRVLQLRNMVATDLSDIYKGYQHLVDEFFDIKVLDPAMGSGHFLVEAVDYITRRMLKFLDQVPTNPVRYELKKIELSIAEEMERQHIVIDRSKLTEINLLKRQVLKRCIYGVDVNPMAVELAKVSVWLDSFTLGAPLSFLDHHLKTGNSLIGTRINEVRKAIEEGQLSLFGNNIWAGALLSTEGMIRVSKLTDVTPGQAHESKDEYMRSEAAIAPYKRLLDVYLSRWFTNSVVASKRDKVNKDKALDFLRSDEAQIWVENGTQQQFNEEQLEILENAERDDKEYRFFHWELEFPEIFIDLKHASLKDNPGFDVVIGNPPYGLINQELLKKFCQTLFEAAEYQIDAYVLFMEQGCYLAHKQGFWGFIVPTTYVSMHYFSKLRYFILTHSLPKELIKLKFSVFEDATVESSIIILQNATGIQDELAAGKAFVYESADEFMSRTKIPVIFNIKDILASEKHNFSFLQDTKNSQLIKHLQSVAWKLSEICVMTVGIKPYQVGKGTPKQTTATVQNRVFDATSRLNETYHRYLMGRDINRYAITAVVERWIAYGDWLAEPRHSAPFFEPSKILVRQTADSIIAVRDEEQFITLNNLHNIKVVHPQLNDHYVLSLLNAKLSTFYHQTQVGEAGRVFAEVKLVDLEKLPIRRIQFVTPKEERNAALKQVKQLFERFLRDADSTLILTFVDQCLQCEPEASDIVHDLLAYLAQVMLSFNKEKYAIQREFLDYLTSILRIQPQPDKNGKVGIDAMKYKAELLNYSGDYQKNEPHLTFEQLKGILLESSNKKRYLMPLTAGVLADIEKAYQNNLPEVLQLKKRLQRTVYLVDQVVYRLYDLNDEEIQVVEGEVQ
ncbi:hypothetical protein KSC_044410 [Ktedonobacter sp. SOSP1-52]|uniref:Eco57I restriction-modification methylase domain-containing protein n=1 Tax=Ktedonobacter sp. SOSP1-52 TaxID=2778366 RepID=UPI00191576DB|nr:TaqI-like C-terminal specificity domain-containing protein [Ktedonobacter sp. SOSP1-52]GHO65549.1 hypothetical protein KSC_044410 [Ktedonobacter sp. SOSP1-52]